MELTTKLLLFAVLLISTQLDGQALEHITTDLTTSLTDDYSVQVNQTDRSADVNFTCLFDWGKGELSVRRTAREANGVFTITLDESGQFNVTVICLSDVSFYESRHSVYVGQPITALTSDSHVHRPPPLTDDLNMTVKFDSGTDVTLHVTVLPDKDPVTLPNLTSGEHAVIISKDFFPNEGIYAIQINASNPLTPLMTIYSALAYMHMASVGDVTFSPNDVAASDDTMYVVTGEPFSINTPLVGDDVTVTWHIQERTDSGLQRHDWVGYYCPDVEEHIFSYSFNSSGDYIVKLQASNFAGYDSHQNEISARPIRNVIYRTENVRNFTNTNFTVYIEFNQEQEYDVSAIICFGDFGNGDNENQTVKTLNASMNETQNVPMVMVEDYLEPGEYNVTVKCTPINESRYINYREEDQPLLNVFVLRENEVIGLEMTHSSSNASHHPFTEVVSVTIDGTNVTFLEGLTCQFDIQFENEEAEIVPVTGDVTNVSQIESALPPFQKAGRYSVSTICSLQLSSQALPELVFDVYFDCWISQYFDDVFRTSVNPRMTMINEHYKLTADIRLKDQTVCRGNLELQWKIYDNQSALVPIATQNVAKLSLAPYTLKTGLYRIALTTTLSDIEPSLNMTDYTWVRVTQPDLHVKVTDGLVSSPVRKALLTDTIVIDTTESFDPAEDPEEATETSDLQKHWSCYEYPPDTTEDEMVVKTMERSHSSDMKNCSRNVLPEDYGEDMHYIAPNTLQSNTWYMFEIELTSGPRQAMTRQAILAYDNDKQTLTMKIVCVDNCKDWDNDHSSKLRQGNLQLNLDIYDNVDTATATYRWTFGRFNPATNSFDDISNRIHGSRGNSGMKVLGSSFRGEEGSRYQVSVDVELKGDERYTKTNVYSYFVLNMPPYNGTCTIEGDVGRTVAASVDDVCFSCREWLDEGLKEIRDPSSDSGASLVYEVVQRYLKLDMSIDPIYRETILDSSSALRQCVRLRLPEEAVDYTMVEVRVKDRYEMAYSKHQFTVGIKAPQLSDMAGDVSELSLIMQKSSQRLSQALQIDDSPMVFSTISVLSSLRALVKVSQVSDNEDSVSFVSGQKGDGSPVTQEDAMDALPTDEVDDNTQADNDMKRELVDYLVQGRDGLTDEAKTDTLTQTSMVSAATGIIGGEEDTLDNTILEESGNTMGVVIDNLDEIVADNPDSVGFQNLAEELVDGMGKLSDAIVTDAASDFQGVTDAASARDLTENLAELDPVDGDDTRQLTPDESSYGLLKQQQEIDMELQDRAEQSAKQSSQISSMLYQMMEHYPSAKQSSRISSMLYQMTQNYPVSDGAVTTINDKEDSEAVVTLTRVSSDHTSSTTLHGTEATVKMPGVTTGDDKVGIGMYEGETAVRTTIADPSVTSLITSKEVYLNIDMDGDNFDGQMEIQFGVVHADYVLTELIIDDDDADELHRQQVFVRSTVDSLCIVVEPTDGSIDKYKLWITCEGDVSKINSKANAELTKKNNWTRCFTAEELNLQAPDTCKYGIEVIPKPGEDAATAMRRRRSAVPGTEPGSRGHVMNITAATMAFLLWDEASGTWQGDACATKWLPEERKLIGRCPPSKQMTFANSFYVPPNTIDFRAAFLRFSPRSQAAVLATLVCIFLLYVLVVIWARHVDREDLLKWGITPLADNFAEDNYFYIIKVYTGLRPGAGTRSKVGFVVGGEDIDTGLRELSDGVRKEFSTGSVMNYLMAAPSHLGHLEYIRLWHDNSGKGSSASWYLSRLEIQDVQRNETFTFLVERWLALDRDDGLLECVVPVCKVENLNIFRHRFNTNAKETLADSHIWISILYRPVTSHFTRVQRSSCALVFLMLTMISNAMFYQAEENYETPAIAQIGPFYFTMQQVYISIICTLITTPATLLLVYLFKWCRCGSEHLAGKPLYARFERASRYRIPFTESWIEKKYRESLELEQNLLAKGVPKLQGYYLPQWCAIIAWLLVALTVLLSSFFLLLYSMMWGQQKSEEWFTSFFLSFFESVFCLDPIKVVATAMLLALLMRSTEEAGFIIDRQTIMRKYKTSYRGKSGGLRLPAPPLDPEKLAKARALKERDVRMATAIRDIIINVVIIWVSCSISYSTRDPWSYSMHQETIDTLLQPAGKLQPSFLNIKTTQDYFDWLNKTAIMNMFPETDVSGKQLHWRMRQLLQDGAKLRVGPPRLRQLRTTEEKCTIPFIGERYCYSGYTESTEDYEDYCLGWKHEPCSPGEKVYKHSADAWKFTSALDIWGFPISGHHTTYGGGGYISKLSVNRDVSHLILEELYNSSWIDRQTRAVLFEFTLYGINANIFTYNIFMAEFPSTGGVFPYVMILPLRLHMHVGALGMYTLVCEIIYLIYLVVMSISTGLALLRQKSAFFKKPWQVYDFVYICISYVALIMYFVRLAMTNQSLERFKQDPKEFVNFIHIALWDQIYVIVIGILVSMATLRMLNVLGYNKRISTVANVFTNAASELAWFGIFFFYVYMSYAVFGYLLFGSKLKSYKNVYSGMGTLFISMIGKSRFTEIEATDPVMSKIYFMIFIFFVVYMILTMFLAVLSKSIDQVHQNIKRTKRDEMVEYVINKFKHFLALYRPRHKKGQRKRPPQMPWSTIMQQEGGQVDSKMILKDIRWSLKEAIPQEKMAANIKPVKK